MKTRGPLESDDTHYSIYLPDGFIELPGGEPDEQKLRQLTSAVAVRFGLPGDADIDEGLAKSAVLLMTLGASSSAGGSHYTAVGIFRSQIDAERPIMAAVNCFALPSDHDSPSTAIDGLQQHYKHSDQIQTVQLPAGDAVIVQSRAPETLTVGDHTVEVTKNAITAWIPNPLGNGLLGVAVTSNNAEDWTDIVDMAEGIFETVEWMPMDRASSDTSAENPR